MVSLNLPVIGAWYQNIDGQRFKIVAVDDHDRAIEIQYFDGEIGEIDEELWFEQSPQSIAAPEDCSGPFDGIEKEEYGGDFDLEENFIPSGSYIIWEEPGYGY